MMGGFGMGFGLIWIVVLALVVWGVWSYLKRNKGTGSSENQALDILKERYARGEISKEEFEEMKKNLKS
jgi:putative membrane protein